MWTSERGKIKMKVLRKQEVTVLGINDFKIGDQIKCGLYTATCHKITKKCNLSVRPVFKGCLLDEPCGQ